MRHTLLYHNINIFICSLKSSGLPYWVTGIKSTSTWWYWELFPLMHSQNVQASWLLAVIFALCSSAAFWWHNSQLSLLLWCVWAFISLFNINRWTSYKSQSLFSLRSNSELIRAIFVKIFPQTKVQHITCIQLHRATYFRKQFIFVLTLTTHPW